MQSIISPASLQERTNLTTVFKHDHKKIITLYDEILASAKEMNFSFISRFLEEFSSLCSYHFFNEAQFIYDFLKKHQPFQEEKEAAIFIKHCDDLQSISNNLFQVISSPKNVPVNENTVDHFIKDFERVGIELKRRVDVEEKYIFPLYEEVIGEMEESV